MGDNAAAEKVFRQREKLRQEVEAMEKGTQNGLKAFFQDIKKRAELAREIQQARESGGTNQNWFKKIDNKFGEVGDEFTGYGERPWERD